MIHAICVNHPLPVIIRNGKRKKRLNFFSSHNCGELLFEEESHEIERNSRGQQAICAHLCRYYRSQNKLSTDLAKKLYCSKSVVESYESYSDERGPATYETILRLSSGFDLSPTAFIKILEGKLNEQSEAVKT